MNIEVKLETDCKFCNGLGRIRVPNSGFKEMTDEICYMCEGQGSFITDFGQAILQLVRKHKERLLKPE